MTNTILFCYLDRKLQLLKVKKVKISLSRASPYGLYFLAEGLFRSEKEVNGWFSFVEISEVSVMVLPIRL